MTRSYHSQKIQQKHSYWICLDNEKNLSTWSKEMVTNRKIGNNWNPIRTFTNVYWFVNIIWIHHSNCMDLQPSCQNKMMACNVYDNCWYIIFVRFILIASTFLQYMSHHIMWFKLDKTTAKRLTTVQDQDHVTTPTRCSDILWWWNQKNKKNI